MSKPAVLVTFDSMKDPNRGYFSFGRGLGDALIQVNNDRFKLFYYLYKNTPHNFNKEAAPIYLSPVHRLFFPERNKFSIVHFTDHTFRLKPGKVNAKKIMTLHDMNKVHLKFSKPASIKRYLKRLKGNLIYCDKIVTISKFVANDLLRYFPELKDKVSVIYNGADQLIVPEKHIPVYTPKKPFLFTIGLLSIQKGFHLLPALLNNNDYELIISGIETPHRKRIVEEAVKYNCLNRVTITGPISDDDKAWYYKNCCAFVFPSIAEGFGLPVIEAMYFGKPVFLSKFTSLPEIGGNVAYYFDNFDVEHMQEVFNQGMQDFQANDRSKDIIERAHIFSWKAAAEQYLDLYEKCLYS